jgi:hypothetical protein
VAEGITWVIEKDVTIYSRYLMSTPNLTATYNVPNYNTATYTGVIYADLSLTFYVDGVAPDAAAALPKVLPLTGCPGSIVSVSGNQTLAYPVTVTSALTSLFVEVTPAHPNPSQYFVVNAAGTVALFPTATRRCTRATTGARSSTTRTCRTRTRRSSGRAGAGPTARCKCS